MRTVIFASSALLLCGALAGVHVVGRGFSARDEPSALETFAARAARQLAVPPSSRKLTNPFPVTKPGLLEARFNWAQNCAMCHGASGDGQTEIGTHLYPKPPDLRAPATQRQTDGELYTTIQNGIRLTGMPAWGEPRDDDRDRWNLVALIRALPNFTPEDVAEIEQMLPRSPESAQPAQTLSRAEPSASKK